MAKSALIDGDSFAYRFAAAAERKIYLVDGSEYGTHKEAAKAASGAPIWNRVISEDPKNVITSLGASLERTRSRTGAAVFHVLLGSSAPTFRDHIARLKRYKGNRKGPPPTLLSILRDYLVGSFAARVVEGEETDDVLSYMSAELGGDSVVVGYDKDLDQIPGDHYDWVQDRYYAVTDAEARLRVWVQALSGDVADNIGGCWGCGVSKATRLVADSIAAGADDKTLWRLVIGEYERSQEREDCPYKNYDPKEVAEENYALVRLRKSRTDSYTYKGLQVPLKTGTNDRIQVGRGPGEI